MDTGVKTGMTLSIIAALAHNGVIGRDGDMPWKLPNDLKRFKELTRGHIVICGRKTYDSIIKRLGKPLPDRNMIVLSRRALEHPEGVIHALDWGQALVFADQLVGAGADPEVFVIGGAEVYKFALPVADRMYLTCVFATIPGDAFFPLFNIGAVEWELKSSQRQPRDDKDQYGYSFDNYFRIKETSKIKEQYLNMDNARHDDQREVMQRLLERGVCPFCPEHVDQAELKPMIKETTNWHVRANRWPYENTRVHLLVIHRGHITRLTEMSAEAVIELLELAKWAEAEYKVKGGALVMRFGEPGASGATVDHLHWHWVAADITDRSDPNYKPVRARIG